MTYPSRRERAAAHAQRRRRGRNRIWIAMTVVAVLAIGGLGLTYWHLQSNITRIDVTSALSTDRPTEAAGPLNVLLIGSDSRVGQNQPDSTSVVGARSDTTVIAHISADRQHVTMVSVPRDSMVKMPPDCKANVPHSEWTVQQFNAAFAMGGPACLINTIEGDTGVRIDHFAVVDFSGFKNMVDALGGVPVCTPTAIKDKDAHLDLAAGRHVLDGTQALGYVRARHAEGDGSDLGRIKRQQAFLSSVVQEATRTSLLLRPDKLFGFLNAATQSLTTDTGFDLGTMKDLASSVAHVGMDKVVFVTVPVETYQPDPNRVQWTPAADLLWAKIIADEPLIEDKPSPSASSSASGSASPSASPSSSATPSPSPSLETRTADQSICS